MEPARLAWSPRMAPRLLEPLAIVLSLDRQVRARRSCRLRRRGCARRASSAPGTAARAWPPRRPDAGRRARTPTTPEVLEPASARARAEPRDDAASRPAAQRRRATVRPPLNRGCAPCGRRRRLDDVARAWRRGGARRGLLALSTSVRSWPRRARRDAATSDASTRPWSSAARRRVRPSRGPNGPLPCGGPAPRAACSSVVSGRRPRPRAHAARAVRRHRAVDVLRVDGRVRAPPNIGRPAWTNARARRPLRERRPVDALVVARSAPGGAPPTRRLGQRRPCRCAVIRRSRGIDAEDRFVRTVRAGAPRDSICAAKPMSPSGRRHEPLRSRLEPMSGSDRARTGRASRLWSTCAPRQRRRRARTRPKASWPSSVHRASAAWSL